MPDKEHRHVGRVLTLYGQDIPGRVLQKDEDWEAELRSLIGGLPVA